MRVLRQGSFIGVVIGVWSICRLGAAENICNETVPANRFVDGCPAYSQCDASTNSAIYSDNGIDTSTTSVGAGWVRTQWSGGYQCTEYAGRYLYFKWDIRYQGGSAKDWCDGSFPSTLTKTTTPVHGDVIVFAPGSCGADMTYGHVAVVDTVDTARSSVTFVEQNRAGRRSCAISTAACFLHATANSGTTSDAGLGGAGSSTNPTGTGGRASTTGAGGSGGFIVTSGSGGNGSAPPGSDGAISGSTGTVNTGAGGTAGFRVSGGGSNVGAGGSFSYAGVPGRELVPISNSDGSGADCACDLARRGGNRGEAAFLLFGLLALITRKRLRRGSVA